MRTGIKELVLKMRNNPDRLWHTEWKVDRVVAQDELVSGDGRSCCSMIILFGIPNRNDCDVYSVIPNRMIVMSIR